MENIEKFEISKKTLQNLVNYLATKPYAEVVQIFNEIQNLTPIELKESNSKGKKN